MLIYEALGATPPAFAHLSLVLGPDHAPLSKRHGATSVAEFRDRGYLPESLVNYLALLGWSPGEGQELLPIAEMVTRFDLSKVGHSAAVFDTGKLAWMNRHYMKEADPARLADLAIPVLHRAGYVGSNPGPAAREWIESALLPMAVGSVDRVDEIAERVRFVFDWSAEQAAELVRAEPDGETAVAAFAEEVAGRGPLDRETFRAAAARARERTKLKGRALFHPIRVAETAAESGPELDLAIPAIDRGAALPPGVGVARNIASTSDRVKVVTTLLQQNPGTPAPRNPGTESS
jgi:glutamyl-tRNA synthetase/nondiscriminating glutamyl-tRNA synthetase